MSIDNVFFIGFDLFCTPNAVVSAELNKILFWLFSISKFLYGKSLNGYCSWKRYRANIPDLDSFLYFLKNGFDELQFFVIF